MFKKRKFILKNFIIRNIYKIFILKLLKIKKHSSIIHHSPSTIHRPPFTVHRLPFIVLIMLWSACGVPRASFTHLQNSYTAPATVQFKNTSTGAERYEWDFGDGTLSDTLSPVHQYTHSGNYLVTLKARKGKQSIDYQEYIAVRSPDDCTVKLGTEFGDMTIMLFHDTPEHRDNFLKLISQQFYDDLLFHRVVPGFVIQGGDPKSRNASLSKRIGSGGPGYTVPAEFSHNRIHVRGALAAARDDNPQKASSGSQFYIVDGRECTAEGLDKVEKERGFRYTSEQRTLYLREGGAPQLDQEYTVFGMVVEGLDVIDKITALETKNDRPQQNVTMKIREIE